MVSKIGMIVAVIGFAFADASGAHAQSRPPEPYVARGACPFECCLYGEWRAEERLRIYTQERDTTAVAFAIQRGERFTAQTGNVHITRLGIAVVKKPLHQAGYDEGGRRFEAGDTVYILDYLGEGYSNVWYRGEVLEATAYWHSEKDITLVDRDEVRTILLQEPEDEWWVKVVDGRGRAGWLFMREAKVDGADACG